VTDVDRAVLDLKVQKRKLGESRKRMEASADKLSEKAKMFVLEKKKDKAIQALRHKKLLEQAASRVDAQIFNIEQTLGSITEAQQTSEVLQRLKAGSAALKSLQEGLKIEEVDTLMDDIAEAKADEIALNERLAESLTPEQDEEAEAELQLLDDEIMKEELPAIPGGLVQPVPTKPEAEREEDGAEALREAAGSEGVLKATEPMLLAA